MYGKFSISLYSNSSISNLIKKIDIFDVILISNDVLDEGDKEYYRFFKRNWKKSIYLTKINIKKDVFKNKGINPNSIINIPFSFNNIVQQIEIFIRENSKK